MKPTRHTGYRSFSYLEADVDYMPFELAREVGRVSSRRVEVSPAEEGRALRLLDEHIVISLHDHVTVAPRDVAKMPEYRRQGREWTGYEGLAASGLTASSTRSRAVRRRSRRARGGRWTSSLT